MTKNKHPCKVAVMHLITMAHPGEAQGVIEGLKLNRIDQNTFQGDELILVLTGEGPFEAATRTALAISRFGSSHVINLGIAGSLTPELKVGEIAPIRTIYLINQGRPDFKTFQSAVKGVDCLTSFERILDPEKAKKFRGLGHLVDREAWGVALAAKTAGVSFESHKVISDFAGTIEACELVKEKAQEFSRQLFQKLSEILNSPLQENTGLPHLPGFYFTFSTGHKFKTLLHKLTIKEEKTPEEILHSYNISSLQSREMLPKERTRILLDLMEGQIDPVKGKLLSVASELFRQFSENGIKIQFDQNWENPKVTLSLEASSDSEVAKKIEGLKKVSIKSFTNLMEGKFDVE